MKKFPMTLAGSEKLKKELSRLKSEVRPALTQSIATARALGDLSENAEYHAAREAQGLCEARIQEIESKLASAQIIKVGELPASQIVRFGYVITLSRAGHEEEITYQIVGEDEADLAENKLSIQSPLARAMIGKETQEVFSVVTPAGEVHYVVQQVAQPAHSV